MSNSILSIHQLTGSWHYFFHHAIAPDSLVMFRIAFGLLLLADALYLAKSLTFLYGATGILDRGIYIRDFRARFFSIYNWGADEPARLHLWFALHVTAIICLLLGFFSNIAAFIIFAGLTSYHHRNPFAVNSGDVAMRLMAFLMIFAPADASFSVLTAIGAKPVQSTIDPWAYRLLQILVSTIYFKSMYWKLHGRWWLSGRAVYYVLNIDRYRRFALPTVLRNKLSYQSMNYATIAIWGSLSILIWIDEFRYPAIAVGLLFHLGMDYCLRIRLFQWVMMTGLVLFIDPVDLVSLYLWAIR